MKRRRFYIVICIAISAVLLISNFCFAKYSGGSGEPNDPYLIATPADMNTIGATSADWSKCFKLVADINIAYTGTQYKIIGSGYETPFTGTFDGDGHKIINLTYTATTTVNYVGLFGYIQNAAIKNLGVEDVNISGDSYVGGLCGKANSGTISNCYSTGNVSGYCYIGGLCGENYGNNSITDCYSTGNVSGDAYTGGLCGGNSANITNCYSTGTATGRKDTGGLCGMANSGTISNCYSTGNVRGSALTGGLCGESWGSITGCYSAGNVSGEGGGLCGTNRGSITNCYSTGNISNGGGGLCRENLGNIISCYSTGNVSGWGGGLCGYNWQGNITNCYSTGNVNGTSTSVGGLCGYNDHGNIAKCYSTGSVSGSSYVGGLCGRDYGGSIISCYFLNTAGPDNGLGEPLTDAQMKQQASFADWDFSGENADGTSSYWIMKPSNYPQLYVFDSNFISYEFDGQGTVVDPYLIYDANDLGAVWQKPYNCYKLVNDISLAGIWWSDAIVPGFTGSFDGGNHIISKLSISGGSYLGLFGKLNSGSIVKNVGIEDVNITGTRYYIGGLCGYNRYASITKCYSTGNVSGYSYTGGLCGGNYDGSITKCYSTGNVSGGYNFTGGLCGYSYYGKITNCYYIGIVTGSSYTGGLCGYNIGASRISNCYSAGNVSGTNNVGGLCGGNLDGSFTSCYFLDTAGVDNGFGEPLTDAQMKQEISFTGWDFSYTDGDEADWFMAFESYPILTWEISPADIYTDGENNFKDWTVFANYWMREDCRMYNDFCEFSDMDFDGDVDIDDLAEFMSYWLEKGIY